MQFPIIILYYRNCSLGETKQRWRRCRRGLWCHLWFENSQKTYVNSPIATITQRKGTNQSKEQAHNCSCNNNNIKLHQQHTMHPSCHLDCLPQSNMMMNDENETNHHHHHVDKFNNEWHYVQDMECKINNLLYTDGSSSSNDDDNNNNMDMVEALHGAVWAAKAFLQQLDLDEDACMTLDHTLHFIHTTYADLMMMMITTSNGSRMEA